MYVRRDLFSHSVVEFWCVVGCVFSVLSFPGPLGAAEESGSLEAILSEVDLEFWSNIQGSRSSDGYYAYLEVFPGGQYAAHARERIRVLDGAPRALDINRTPAPPEHAATRPELAIDQTAPVRDQGRDSDIAVLLGRARAALQKKRFTSPSADNTVKWAKRVLDHDPINTDALDLLSEVVGIYVGWARTNLQRARYQRSERYVAKVRRLRQYGTHFQLAEVAMIQRTLAGVKAKAEADAEAQRLAAEERRRADAASVEPEPESGILSSITEWFSN